MRRLLHEAKDSESFSLKYTKLGSPPLTLNATADAARSVTVSPGGGIECVDGAGGTCGEQELELLNRPLSRWAEAMLGFFSFPVPEEGSLSELGCVC